MAQTGNRELRERFAVKYRRLCDEVTALLGRHNPMGIIIWVEHNPYEYSFESSRIVKGLHRCRTEEDVRRAVEEEFLHAFGCGPDESKEFSARIARELWALWQTRLQDDATAWSLLEEEGKEVGKSHCTSFTLSCPKCKTETDVFVWDRVNGDDDPSLRDDLLEGRLNVSKCGSCGEELSVGDGNDDLLYMDTRRGYGVKYCSLWMETTIEDLKYRDAFFKSAFTKDAKIDRSDRPPAEIEPPWMAEPHIVLDMGELRRYVRFRDRLFDLYEKLGDEYFPPSK